MMAKRRGLGSSTATHKRKGAGDAQRTKWQAYDTARALERGRCDRAFEHLLEATGAFAQHIAHIEATGENHDREAASFLSTARARFKSACLR